MEQIAHKLVTIFFNLVDTIGMGLSILAVVIFGCLIIALVAPIIGAFLKFFQR
jgi:hypothetical protein